MHRPAASATKVALAVALALVLGSCSTAIGSTGAGARLEVLGVTDKLRVEWSVDEPRPGDRRITGYVYNDYGLRANPVQILVEGLDATGQPVFQRVEYVLGGVPGFNRTYFDVRSVPGAPDYRVRIFSFNFVDSDDRFRRW
jgi:hypothetical protein